MTSPYHPIACEFHDRLEDHATTRRPTQIRFRDDQGVERSLSATITDVYARSGSEYLTTSTGETLRLDQLLEVDGERLADY
jgi:Rho-binding antiterminator